MNFEEFCAAHGIEAVEVQYLGHEDRKGDGFTTRSYAYALRLQLGHECHRRTHAVERYTVGCGIVEGWAKRTDARPARPVVVGGERISRASQLPGRWSTLAGRAFCDAAAEQYAPTAADVLECLATDAQSVQSAGSFEEWAGDLGYDDSDSRTAERTYRACVDEALGLQRWLGLELYAALLACEG